MPITEQLLLQVLPNAGRQAGVFVPVLNAANHDELASVVDGTVARLCKRAPEMGDFVWLYYAVKWPAKRIGNKYEMSEAKAREIIKTGVGWIDCSLERFIEAA
nr:antiterminator Q family protein [Pseudomonas lactis]